MSFLLNILSYFFNPQPTGPFSFSWLFIAMVVIALAAAITLRMYLKKRKDDKIFRKLFRNLPGKFLLIAILETLYIISRYEQMAYTSIRFLNFMILAYTAYILFHYSQLYFKVYPTQKKHHDKQVNLNKYLPRKHHS